MKTNLTATNRSIKPTTANIRAARKAAQAANPIRVLQDIDVSAPFRVQYFVPAHKLNVAFGRTLEIPDQWKEHVGVCTIEEARRTAALLSGDHVKNQPVRIIRVTNTIVR